METSGPEQVAEDNDDDDWGMGALRGRRKARALALQALFEVDASGHTAEAALTWILAENEASPRTQAFIRVLVNGVGEHVSDLDQQIQRFAPTWPLSQLALVDRNILRLAIFELTVDQQAPPKAVINEAIELAKLFGGDSAPRFVNGVLGALMESLAESPKE
jgi:N utilization substance protein B